MTLRAQDEEKAAKMRKMATHKSSLLALILDGKKNFALFLSKVKYSDLEAYYRFFILKMLFISDSIISWGKFRYKKTNGDVWTTIDKSKLL